MNFVLNILHSMYSDPPGVKYSFGYGLPSMRLRTIDVFPDGQVVTLIRVIYNGGGGKKRLSQYVVKGTTIGTGSRVGH